MSPTSSWSPFRGQLILSNLPPQIRPSQIRKILTLLPPPDGPIRVRPRDPELEVVQVYLRPVKARRQPSARGWRFGRNKAQDRLESKAGSRTGRSNGAAESERQDRAAPGEQPRDRARGAEQPIERTTTRVQEVADEGEPEDDQPEIVSEAPPGKSQDKTAIAYLYFRNEYARWQAEMAFRSLTIDGRKVQVDTKVVDTAPFRRLWAKMH